MLGLGFKVLIHQAWEEPEVAFLRIALVRTLLMASHCASVVAAVQEELAAPVRRTPRLAVWQAERKLYAVAGTSDALGESYQRLVAAARSANRGRGSWKDVGEAAHAVIERASASRELQAAIEALPSPELANHVLANQVSIESLLDPFQGAPTPTVRGA